jgi:hypothetical protein
MIPLPSFAQIPVSSPPPCNRERDDFNRQLLHRPWQVFVAPWSAFTCAARDGWLAAGSNQLPQVIHPAIVVISVNLSPFLFKLYVSNGSPCWPRAQACDALRTAQPNAISPVVLNPPPCALAIATNAIPKHPTVLPRGVPVPNALTLLGTPISRQHRPISHHVVGHKRLR